MHLRTLTHKVTATDRVEVVESMGYHAFAEDDIHWWKQPGLRRLYMLMPFLFLGSTTLGYDGSLLNGLQAMPTWQECMSWPMPCFCVQNGQC